MAENNNFDPDAYLAETEETTSGQFDPDAYLAESEPSFAEKAVDAVPRPAVGAAIGGALGTGVKYGAKATGAAGSLLTEALGPLTKEEVGFISENPDLYRSVPLQEQFLDKDVKGLAEGVITGRRQKSGLLEQDLGKLAEKTNQAGYDFAREAKVGLPSDKVPREEVLKGIGKALLDKETRSNTGGATIDLDPQVEERYKAQRIQEELGMVQPTVDRRMGLERELEETKLNLKSDPYKPQIDKIRSSKQKLINDFNKQREKFLSDNKTELNKIAKQRDIVKEEMIVLQKELNSKDLSQADVVKKQIQLEKKALALSSFDTKEQKLLEKASNLIDTHKTKIQNIDEKLADLSIKSMSFPEEKVKPLQDLDIRIQELLKQEELLKQAAKQRGIEGYKKSLGIPEELVRLNPELEKIKMAPGFTKSLDPVMELIGQDPEISLDRIGGRTGLLAQLKDISSSDVKTDTATNKLTTSMSKGVREQLKQVPGLENYVEKQGLSAKAINLTDRLKGLGYVVDEDTSKLIPTATKQKQVLTWLDDPQAHANKLAELRSVMEEASSLGLTPPAGLLDELEELRETEALFEKSGMAYDPKTKGVFFGEGKKANVARILAEASENSDEFKAIKSAVEQTARLQGVPESQIPKLVDDFLTKAKASNIKSLVKNQDMSGAMALRTKGGLAQLAGRAVPTVLGGAAGAGIGGGDPVSTLLGTIVGTGAGLALDKEGGKLQEAIGLLKGSDKVKAVGKGLGRVVDALPYVGAGAGLLMGLEEAQAAGFSPEASAAIGVTEAANPVPFTSVTEAAKAVREIPTEQLTESVSPEFDPNFIPGGPTQVGATVAGAALKGFTKPIGSLLQAFKEGAQSSYGKPNPASLREKYEQQLQKWNEVKQTPGVDLQKATPEHLQMLASDLAATSPAAEIFASELQRAANADQDMRDKILTGLNQQPAFRQLIQRLNKR